MSELGRRDEELEGLRAQLAKLEQERDQALKVQANMRASLAGIGLLERADMEAVLRETIDYSIEQEKETRGLFYKAVAALERIAHGYDNGVMPTRWSAMEAASIAEQALKALR